MSIRWDLKPLFKNAEEGSDMANWTRRSAISGTVALVAFGIASWNVEIWQMLIMVVVLVAAFDAGDMRFPFDDDEAESAEEIEMYEAHADGTVITPHDRMYRP